MGDLLSKGASASAIVSEEMPFVDYQYPVHDFCGIILVGEAPGADEVRLGQPFVGRSGQLLDRALAQVGIDRSACVVANVFRYRPPQNKIDQFFLSRRQSLLQGKAIDPSYGTFAGKYVRADFTEELRQLTSLLETYTPKAIIGLGRTPLWALCGEEGLLQKVGAVRPCRLWWRGVVMPTYHPSYIMRGNWGLQAVWGEHLKQMMA